MVTSDRELVRYHNAVYDSARWKGFALRPGDIVITTPPKCGTTWTQMICALLILQQPELDRPLTQYSPWLDMLTRARRDVVADLESQPHRRFIKTHTPLDGLPADPSITYICVGRDPRDVGVSMDNHRANMNEAAFDAAREEAARIDGIDLEPAPAPSSSEGTQRERFWAWVEDDTPVAVAASSLLRTLRHLESFWNAPDALDVVMLHYDDLRADLGAEMRSLADRLNITVPDALWPSLIAAATFDSMKTRSDVTAPSADRNLWHDRRDFFHRGTSGQWRELLDEADVARYRARVAALVPPALAAWVHRD